jgi:voltage-gated potassium channel
MGAPSPPEGRGRGRRAEQAAEKHYMEQQQGPRWLGRVVERRVEVKGRLTPRLAAALVAGFWLVGVVVFGIVERLVDPDTFDNVWLGMWWALQTVTTVGFGDVVPESTAGKLIASVLMLGGLSLFGVVTGAITSIFVTQAQVQAKVRGAAGAEDPVAQRLDEMNAQLERLGDEVASLRSTGG